MMTNLNIQHLLLEQCEQEVQLTYMGLNDDVIVDDKGEATPRE